MSSEETTDSQSPFEPRRGGRTPAGDARVRVLGLSGSLHGGSYSTALLRAATRLGAVA